MVHLKNSHSYRFQRGVALTELALVLPVMMLLLIGLIEWGRLAYYSILIGNAAHAGVQYGAQSTATARDTTGMQSAATSDGQSISGLTAVAQIVCSCWNGTTETPSAPTSAACGQSCPTTTPAYHSVVYVQVTTTGKTNTLFNYTALGIPQQWTLSRTATMRVNE